MKTSQYYLPSLLTSILFVLSALFVFGLALLMAVSALVSLLNGSEVKTEQTVLLVGFAFQGLTLVAAAFFSFQKLLQKPAADRDISLSLPVWLIISLAIAAGASILTGYEVSKVKAINWLVLPILTIPAVVFPLVVLLMFATRRLPAGTRWQTWNVLGLGMTLAPLLLVTLEIIVGIVIFLCVVAYIATQPALLSDLEKLLQQIRELGPESEAARNLLAPFLTKPWVIITALIYIAILVPAIEEMIKPLGVWIFAGKLNSPAQGFTLGALSGAAYGLIETLNISGQSGDWAGLLSSRIGTGLLHITTSALLGTAIILAWHQQRYLRLFGTYLLAILLHGLWNALAILLSASGLSEFMGQPGRLSSLQTILAIGMVILAMVLFGILVISNRRLRRTASQSLAEATVSSENETLDTGPVA